MVMIMIELVTATQVIPSSSVEFKYLQSYIDWAEAVTAFTVYNWYNHSLNHKLVSWRHIQNYH